MNRLGLVGLGHGSRADRSKKQVACGFGVAILAGLIWMTSRDLPRWQNSRQLFESAIRVAPHKVAYNNLAYFCIRQGEYDEAVGQPWAIELDSNYGPHARREPRSTCVWMIMLGLKPTMTEISLGIGHCVPIPAIILRQLWELIRKRTGSSLATIGFAPRPAEDFVARADGQGKAPEVSCWLWRITQRQLSLSPGTAMRIRSAPAPQMR